MREFEIEAGWLIRRKVKRVITECAEEHGLKVSCAQDGGDLRFRVDGDLAKEASFMLAIERMFG